MIGGIVLGQLVLGVLVLCLTFAFLNVLLPRKEEKLFLAERAENFLFTDYELRRRKEGWLVNQLTAFLPRMEGIMALSSSEKYQTDLAMMGTQKLPNRFCGTNHKSRYFAGTMVAVPFLTGSKIYFCLVPAGFIASSYQNREIYQPIKNGRMN